MQVNKNILLAATPLGTTNSAFTFDRLVGILNYLVFNAFLLGELIATGAIIFYGFKMVLARTDPKKFTEAKDSLLKALIGAAMIFGVYTIIRTIMGIAANITN